MVLVTPLLLMVMAVIINAGTVACWKVRALSIAREAVWSTRFPRSGNSDPRPSYWPLPTGTSGTNGPTNVPALDDPRVDLPVARGPLPGAQVNAELLDPTTGLRTGLAGLTRNYPMLAKLGQYNMQAETQMLDNRWQYPQMGMVDNLQRRIPVIYALGQAPASLSNAYMQAIEAIIYAPFAPQLAPLDHDPEFIAFTGGAPDFHPKYASCWAPGWPCCTLGNPNCSLDTNLVQQNVQNLINQIQGQKNPHIPSVAETMTQAFMGLYSQEMNAYQNQMNANPPPSQSVMAGLQASFGQAQSNYNTLKQFNQTLQ
jgi:hypothetical protein